MGMVLQIIHSSTKQIFVFEIIKGLQLRWNLKHVTWVTGKRTQKPEDEDKHNQVARRSQVQTPQQNKHEQVLGI
jgi:hypothetical protein